MKFFWLAGAARNYFGKPISCQLILVHDRLTRFTFVISSFFFWLTWISMQLNGLTVELWRHAVDAAASVVDAWPVPHCQPSSTTFEIWLSGRLLVQFIDPSRLTRCHLEHKGPFLTHSWKSTLLDHVVCTEPVAAWGFSRVLPRSLSASTCLHLK